MSVEKTLIMTLEKTPDRLTSCLGALSTVHIPNDTLTPVYGNDDFDYEKSRHVCEAAAADGFDVFGKVIDTGEHNRKPISDITQAWNFCRLWRKVIELDVTCLIIQDDYTLAYPIVFLDIAHIVRDLSPDILILAGSPDYAAFRRETVMCTDGYGTRCVRGIINNQDMGMIVSPIGAQYLIESVSEFFHVPDINVHSFQDILNLFGQREYETLKSIDVKDYDRFESRNVFTVLGDYICRIFDPESELWQRFKSSVHADNVTLIEVDGRERWPLIRPIEETADDIRE